MVFISMGRLIRKLVREGLLKEDTKDGMTFLGYHSSTYDLGGFTLGETLDPDTYPDIIRTAYMEFISDYDENLENNDTDVMNDVFEELGYSFTFVSSEPIKGSAYQYTKYKYGEYLFKVYGGGSEYLLTDPNELDAEIIISTKPLYFELIDGPDDEEEY